MGRSHSLGRYGEGRSKSEWSFNVTPEFSPVERITNKRRGLYQALQKSVKVYQNYTDDAVKLAGDLVSEKDKVLKEFEESFELEKKQALAKLQKTLDEMEKYEGFSADKSNGIKLAPKHRVEIEIRRLNADFVYSDSKIETLEEFHTVKTADIADAAKKQLDLA